MNDLPKVAIDFETDKIENRPVYPPKPVAVSIKPFGRKAKYYSWGHPCENNCTKREVEKLLVHHWRNSNCVFQNAGFDIEVAIKWFSRIKAYPKQWEDTLFLAYLHDPRDKTLSLKPMAEHYLDMPPKEANDLRDWILTNTECKNTKKDPWEAYISKAPGKLAGKYGNGDTIRTEKLFKFFYPQVKEMGMLPAYEREKRCLPIFEEMSATGLRINTRRLKKDIGECEQEFEKLEKQIKRKLKAKDLDINSNKQLADALDKANKIDQWFFTKPSKTYPNGQRSTSRPNLIAGCNDKKLIYLLSRYGKLSTYLSTFMHPWLERGEQYKCLYPTFSQVRTPNEHGKVFGTRTGRPSSSNPNFLNIPKGREDFYTEGLPKPRNYIIADEGCVLNCRDYSQQEIRLLAHFEDSTLLRMFNENPRMDVHQEAVDLIYQSTGIVLSRDVTKNIVFGIIYGMGLKKLAATLDVEFHEAKLFKDAYFQAFPGIKQLVNKIQTVSKQGDCIKTIGGRIYYTEEPAFVDGQKRTFEYKQTNYLIQGSAADVTKQAMINVYENCDHSRLMLQVYDELLISSERKHRVSEMKKMKEAMEVAIKEDLKIDVPMLSDGKWSNKSWGEMKSCK